MTEWTIEESMNCGCSGWTRIGDRIMTRMGRGYSNISPSFSAPIFCCQGGEVGMEGDMRYLKTW